MSVHQAMLWEPHVVPVESAPTYRLRPYQQEAHAAIMAGFEKHRRVLAVMATGLGKTVVAGHIAKEFADHGRVLMICNMDTLVRQSASKLAEITGLPYEIEMGDQWANEDCRAQVICSSVQTQTSGDENNSRMKRFDPNDFSLLIVDEAHGSVSPTCREVIDYYGRNPNLKTLGITATPNRTDERALGLVYEEPVYNYPLRPAIDDGWLVDLEVATISIAGMDLQHVSVNRETKDLSQDSLTRELDKHAGAIAEGLLKYCGDRRTLVFTPPRPRGEKRSFADVLEEILNSRKPDCARSVHGTTQKLKKHSTLADFKARRFQFLTQCMVCSVGYDDPGIECVALCRPSGSATFVEQAIGRGTRPLAGVVDGLLTDVERRNAIAASAKPKLRVLDFAGNCSRVSLIHPADILGGDYSDEAIKRAQKRIEENTEQGKTSDLRTELRLADREIADEIERARQKRINQRKQVRVTATFSEQWIDIWDRLDIPLTGREYAWHRGRQLSDKMRAALVRNHINPDALNYTQALRVLDEMHRHPEKMPATDGQIKALKRFGLSAANKAEAHRLLDELAANGWKRPKPVQPAAEPPHNDWEKAPF